MSKETLNDPKLTIWEKLRILGQRIPDEAWDNAAKMPDGTPHNDVKLMSWLSSYISPDDCNLDRKTFLRYIADRIYDDLESKSHQE